MLSSLSSVNSCSSAANWTCSERELLAVDGTRLKAVNSTDRNFTREKLVK